MRAWYGAWAEQAGAGAVPLRAASPGSWGQCISGNGSCAGLLSDALLCFGMASFFLPVKWANNSTCQSFLHRRHGQASALLGRGQRQGCSLCLAGAGGATYRSVAGSAGPGAVGERVG